MGTCANHTLAACIFSLPFTADYCTSSHNGEERYGHSPPALIEERLAVRMVEPYKEDLSMTASFAYLHDEIH